MYVEIPVWVVSHSGYSIQLYTCGYPPTWNFVKFIELLLTTGWKPLLQEAPAGSQQLRRSARAVTWHAFLHALLAAGLEALVFLYM